MALTIRPDDNEALLVGILGVVEEQNDGRNDQQPETGWLLDVTYRRDNGRDVGVDGHYGGLVAGGLRLLVPRRDAETPETKWQTRVVALDTITELVVL